MKKLPLLVVDDEMANLQKLRRTFVTDFEVHQAGSGEEALELLGRHRYTVIITDQRMPGLSGVELLRESLKTSPEAIRIILTGYTDAEDLMDAINEGQVHRYVTKPWEPFNLKQTVIQDVELRQLKQENRLLTEQLRIATEVQNQLFPQVLPSIPDLEYLGICRPAREVGGDYYDFLQLQPRKLWIVVADISGKGISAALLMANLQALLRSRAPLHGESVDDLVSDINRLLHDTTDTSKFATLFCGIFDAATKRLSYVNAGHCCPILVRSSENGRPSLESLAATGTIVGMFPETDYQKKSVQLAPGDTLIIYTDGLTESFDDANQEFGETRLEQVITRNILLRPAELGERILEEVRSHAGDTPQDDDQMLVLARVN